MLRFIITPLRIMLNLLFSDVFKPGHETHRPTHWPVI